MTENTAFLKRLLDKTGEGLAVVEDGRIVFANATMTGLLRFPKGESAVGMGTEDVIALSSFGTRPVAAPQDEHRR